MENGKANSKAIDVVVVGELNIDLILNGIRHFPAVGKEVIADQMTLTLGSSSAIFASNLSTLGSSVDFIGRIGDDDFGDHIRSSLSSRGVGTTHIKRSPEHKTGATIVLNVGEDRAMVTHPGAMNYLTIDDATDDALSKARHLHLSSIFLQPGIFDDVVTLFEKAKRLGMTTSLDPQWDPAEKWNLPLAALLPHVDLFLPNIAELNALTGTHGLTSGIDALAGFARTVVVKNGSQGAYAWTAGKLIHQESFLNTQVVDSIGAGDSFDAGFVHSFLQGKTIQECLRFGALTGAVNTTRAGGTTAFADIELVKSIAKSSFHYTF